MESLACFAKATTTAFLGIRPYINPPPHHYLVPPHSRSYTQSSALTRPLSLNLSANPRHGISRISCAPPNRLSYEQDEEEKEVERLLHDYEGELRMLERSFRGNGIMTVHAFPSSFPVNLCERLSYSSECSALGIENMKTAVAYRDSLSFPLSQEQSHDTVAFSTGTPKMRNVTLGVSRGFNIEDGQSISQSDYKTSHRLLSENLLLKSHLVQNLFKFPFDCSQFVARELQVIK